MPSTTSRTILLADDSVTIQKVVELTFMEEDYEVVAVGDGDAALAKLDELTPDLLIVDVHMPGADGYEVCRRAKEKLPGVPVLLLVGTFESYDEEQAARIGADGSLKKPFDSRDLLDKAQELIAAGGRDAASTTEAAPAEAPSPAAAAGGAPAPMAGTPTLDGDDLEPPPQPPPATGSVEPAPVAPRAEPAPTSPASRAPEEAAASSQPSAADAAAPAPSPPPAVATASANGALSDDDVERIARRVAELVGESAVREVAWEVVPDLAEVIIRERIRELEEQVE